MDPVSVEAKPLTLDPPLPGKVSWAGRRMAYTLTEPLPYGESFTLSWMMRTIATRMPAGSRSISAL
jgi:hypothetical protein